MPMIHILPADIFQDVAEGASVMEALRSAGIMLDAPCGGNGKCGKCTVIVEGTEALACQTIINKDMQVSVPEEGIQRGGTLMEDLGKNHANIVAERTIQAASDL